MKELSIEEKAKRYDEAIKLAKDSFNYPDYPGFIRADVVFPELKEDKDERIRQFLIHEVTETSDKVMSYRNMNKKDVLDWLEKQVSINEEAEKEKNDYVSGQFLYCKGSFNEFKEGESYWIEYIGNDTYIGRSDNILNQKFHITPRQLYTWLDPRHPEKQDEQNPIKEHNVCDFCEEKASCINPCLMKLVEQKPADKCKEWYDFIRWFVKQRTDDYTLIPSDDDIHKWGDNILNHARKVFEQEPTEWSEEDEDMCYKAIAVINRLCAEGKDYVWSIKTLKKLFYWLKSLKERYTWKPSEEQMKALENAMSMGAKLDSLYNDLKKLR